MPLEHPAVHFIQKIVPKAWSRGLGVFLTTWRPIFSRGHLGLKKGRVGRGRERAPNGFYCSCEVRGVRAAKGEIRTETEGTTIDGSFERTARAPCA